MQSAEFLFFSTKFNVKSLIYKKYPWWVLEINHYVPFLLCFKNINFSINKLKRASSICKQLA